MTQSLTRRDFLRLAGIFSLAAVAPSLSRLASSALQAEQRPNVLIFLCDALSARHLSLYGYPRPTSPNLERFAQRANVYHQHHSAANFTTPSTASLFTGTYPFTHRVFALGGLVTPAIRPHNLLTTLQPAFTEAAFVQNMYADLVVYQMREKLEVHLSPTEASMVGNTMYDHLFPRDAISAAKTYDQFLFDPKENPGSLFTSLPLDLLRQARKRITEEAWIKTYPDGPPFLYPAVSLFTLEQMIDSAQDMLAGLKSPSFSYTHFMPPHAPYRAEKGYVGKFKDDGWTPDKKKPHPLSQRTPQARLNVMRREYDEFIANLDEEFGRLFDWLDSSGLLDTSYVIFTADHGEMFERGENGHVTPLLYEELVNIPLLVHTPGQTERRDIHTLTSNVDLFPSLAAVNGLPEPETLEGHYLPGLGLPEPPADRPAWILEAARNPSRAPLTKASMALLRWPYKYTRYWGYKAKDSEEIYDLQNDPEELENLIDSLPQAAEMRAEMDAKLSEVDAPYLPS